MFYRLRRRFSRTRFERVGRGILATAPRPAGPGPNAVLSVVSADDLIFYLLALKSIQNCLAGFRIVVIDDGSLGADGRRTLHHQVPGIAILDRGDIARGRLPDDLMWQRLAAVVALNQAGFVIQLDADTLARGTLPEVEACVARRTGFILATRESRSFRPLAEAQAWAQANPSRHIQMHSERLMGGLPGAAGLRYIRGSAGFFGLAPRSLALDQVETLFDTMQLLSGGRFLEWGAEQFAVNLLLANTTGLVALPYPAYSVFDPAVDPAASRFLHFIGAHRFGRGVYRAQAQKIIAELGGAS